MRARSVTCGMPTPFPVLVIFFIFTSFFSQSFVFGGLLIWVFGDSARIPQIIKNYREKSCEGLALLFFLLSLTGNFTYGASVMAYSQERDYFIRALPWLLGSLGTMVEDCIIFVQFRIYSPKRQVKAGGTA